MVAVVRPYKWGATLWTRARVVVAPFVRCCPSLRTLCFHAAAVSATANEMISSVLRLVQNTAVNPAHKMCLSSPSSPIKADGGHPAQTGCLSRMLSTLAIFLLPQFPLLTMHGRDQEEKKVLKVTSYKSTATNRDSHRPTTVHWCTRSCPARTRRLHVRPHPSHNHHSVVARLTPIMCRPPVVSCSHSMLWIHMLLYLCRLSPRCCCC